MAAVAAVVDFDPLRDKAYRDAALGPDVASFLGWYELSGKRPATLENAERALAVFCRMYPRTRLEDVTDGQLIQVFKRFPAAGRRVRVAPYRQFFLWAVLTKRIPRGENPMELVPQIQKPPRKQPKTFTEAEVDTLLSLPVLDAAPLAVLFDAGLRNEEARALTVRRCQPETGRVKVIDGKGGKDRVVPMSARLQQLLADLILLEGLRPDDYVFYAVFANGSGARRVSRSRPIGEGTMSRWFHRCLETAGIPANGRSPHSCRHTFATSWRRRGLAADDLAIVLGHESVRTTSDLYVVITPDEVAERMALIEAGEL